MKIGYNTDHKYTAARIGRSGSKLHPAYIDQDGRLNMLCSCTTTARGGQHTACAGTPNCGTMSAFVKEHFKSGEPTAFRADD
jgi:hypothetical protein